VQNPVGKDVAALEIGAELNFINGEEWHFNVWRHGFNGCHPKARGCRDDFFFAGDEGHSVIANFQPNAIIDFAGQQPERQADHAAAMGEHALHGQMGFASIGGAQHGGDIADLRHGNKVVAESVMCKPKLN
jgi:hypothetical protein